MKKIIVDFFLANQIYICAFSFSKLITDIYCTYVSLFPNVWQWLTSHDTSFVFPSA